MRKRLQIIAALLYAALALSLCGLWVRSYSHCDGIYGSSSKFSGLLLESKDGKVVFWYFNAHAQGPIRNWSFNSIPIDERPKSTLVKNKPTVAGFLFASNPMGFICAIPHWFLVLATGSVAAVCWFTQPWRFSLQAFVLAATFVVLILSLAFALSL